MVFMSLQYKFFTIPIKDLDAAEESFNRFLRTVRLLSIDRKFVENGENSFWALSVEYLDSQKQERLMGKGAGSSSTRPTSILANSITGSRKNAESKATCATWTILFSLPMKKRH